MSSQAALQQHVQLTQYVEADHKAARREYLKHLMEQNKKVQRSFFTIEPGRLVFLFLLSEADIRAECSFISFLCLFLSFFSSFGLYFGVRGMG